MSLANFNKFLPALAAFATLVLIASLVPHANDKSENIKTSPDVKKEISASPQKDPLILRILAIGSSDFKPLEGFDWPSPMGKRIVRKIVGAAASIELPGHAALKEQDAEIVISLAPTGYIPAEQLRVDIQINGSKISELPPLEYGFKEYRFRVPASTLKTDTNLLRFNVFRSGEISVKSHERHIAVEWLRLKLLQPLNTDIPLQ